jgi:hypothetical protein
MGAPEMACSSSTRIRMMLTARLLSLAVVGPLLCGPANAQSAFKTTSEMAKECITDDIVLKNICVGYIIGSIDALENDRHSRGEPSCFAVRPSAQDVVKIYVRAILAGAYERDLPAASVISDAFKKSCARPN